MKYFIFTFLLLTYSIFTAQTALSIEWQKALGGSNYDWGYSIQQTSDNGYISAGSTSSNDGDVSGNHGTSDFWIVKMSSNGNIQWQKSLGGSNGETPQCIRQTTDGGYIVAGSSMSNDGDLTTNHGGLDYWVVKLDTDGNVQWQKSIGGSNNDDAQSIQQTSDGGYIVAGTSSSTDGDIIGNHGGLDYWVVKLDTNGNILWQKSLGGSSGDYANSIQQTFDSGYIIAGWSTSTDGDVTGNHGDSDYWIVKLDYNGNIQWEKSIGGTSSDIGYSAQQTFDGGYIVAGTALTGGETGLPNYWVVKLSNAGNIQWDKYLGGSAHDNGQVIRQTPDWGYIIGGWTVSNNGDVTENHGEQDYWIVRLDSSGNLKWQKTLGGPSFDIFNSIETTADNGYIISGTTFSTTGDIIGNHGSTDVWVVKLSPEQLGVSESSQKNKPRLYPNPAKDFV
ncbi:T9SS C-terminal target domain-containing protein [Chryseobacterium sp. SIMBA_028]|uniref:T9SS C-terminal target domain-containing protein n=2 Tax=Pseudomonadati TaxID=3379134 RepID=UPI00397D5C0E